ncbi:MAG: oxygen-independent coproporphyrinogen III oxidase [Pseudochelatococcus sp.]|jgi:oxygen-independent coproporphyrinogen-3 oxidase|uniref:oxygen-independent coproporphyrinogen III oxidase n=1 Tax=Pseudochelatococcus sp. TaxID=2020869 RepID=UPI003D8B5956
MQAPQLGKEAPQPGKEAPLLEKYGAARLPRYTSYPTAPLFSPAVDARQYGDWLSALAPGTRSALYLHIPFCRAMCWYCGCHTSITLRDQPVEDYLSVLRAEIALVAARAGDRAVIDDVHFGGGTPTIMAAESFLRLMDRLRRHLAFHRDTAIAVEIDPRTLTREMAFALGEAGVRRASLGVQSFDVAVQQAINRMQSPERTAGAIADLRAAGVTGINIDLIYGLPHQTERSAVETAHTAAAMRPDRLAVFGYAHVPSFKKHQRLIDESALPDARQRDAQAEAIAATLAQAGYRRIGLDHYALPDDPLAVAQAAGRLRRNFQGYTTDASEALIGLGASAIGRMPQGFVQNEVATGAYARRVMAGEPATVRGYRLTADDRLRADVIERLMCDFSADLDAIGRTHGVDAGFLLRGNGRLDALRDDGAVEIDGAVIRVHRDRRFIVRAVAACFDAYLDGGGRTHGQAA